MPARASADFLLLLLLLYNTVDNKDLCLPGIVIII